MRRKVCNRLPRLVSAREISEQTGLPRSTIYERFADGSIPVIVIGRSKRAVEEDVAHWIESRKEVAR